METLQEIKNAYAKELGHEDWKIFLNYYGGRHPEWFEQHWTEICIRAQKASLEWAAENTEDLKYIDAGGYRILDTTSITNPENLIR